MSVGSAFAPSSMRPSCIRTKSTPTNSASVQRASRNRNFLRWSPPRTRHPRPEVAAPRTIIRSQAALVVNGNDPAQWQFNTQRGEKISGRCSRTNRLLNEHRRRRKPAPPASLLGAQISATHARRLMIARSCNRPLNPRLELLKSACAVALVASALFHGLRARSLGERASRRYFRPASLTFATRIAAIASNRWRTHSRGTSSRISN